MGNQFLSHIRQVDAICHVVRCFDDDNITHVEGRVDPLEDIDTINLELVLADLESINKRYTRVAKVAKTKDKDAVAELAVLIKSNLYWKKENLPERSNLLKKNKKSLNHYFY